MYGAQLSGCFPIKHGTIALAEDKMYRNKEREIVAVARLPALTKMASIHNETRPLASLPPPNGLRCFSFLSVLFGVGFKGKKRKSSPP